MGSPAFALEAREARTWAGAVVFLFGGIVIDQSMLRAGLKTLIGYQETDEDRWLGKEDFEDFGAVDGEDDGRQGRGGAT